MDIVATRSCDADLVRLAASQEQVIATRQLVSLGMSNRSISRRVDRGLLTPVLPSVYSVGTRPDELTRGGWTFASLLRHRGLAAAASGTAAERVGIWDREPTDAPIRIVTRSSGGNSRPTTSGGIRLLTTRSTTLREKHIVVVRSMPTTTALRTMFDASPHYEPLQLTRMICEARYLKLFDIGRLRASLEESLRVPGTANLRLGLEWYLRGSAGTRSRSEDELVRLIIAARIPFPLVNIRGATGLRGMECDFVWHDGRLVVELDGGGHELHGVPEQDEQRDAALRAEGWIVIRVHYSEVWRQPRAVIARIAAALEGSTTPTRASRRAFSPV